jgi:outer membrane protein OmpA-like peptidoglycan-associated protein
MTLKDVFNAIDAGCTALEEFDFDSATLGPEAQEWLESIGSRISDAQERLDKLKAE